MNIFLGSSSSVEALNHLRKVAMIIEAEGHIPLPWTKSEIFRPGNYILDSLREVSGRIDAAILIFSEDDEVWYRNELQLTTRDNVVLEYGFFVSLLGRERTIICRRGKPRMATDLQGIIYCDLNREYKAENDLVQWLRFLNSKNIV
ncbi:Predicted nucleotide-binding protein containing TIR-like domain-containing protein [Paenibacillus uliginis N3/975]|uniref:Predicted nucleotide-binding protein containing TIR-like domain-containing protein n=1 Tax=Paenibacillus uliginis N3/975 TaxID=1313296 RepID=A0A1X7HP32_9BACL|nr:nucleotide-binding protein [Paenibacillus uliginis]SMF90196.1 Predicted nucleotide-binding protein containing TIR-like domain-containing protein [Paenibacillus uliginis N3/975]